jgi:hypothetical protein
MIGIAARMDFVLICASAHDRGCLRTSCYATAVDVNCVEDMTLTH